MKKVLIVVAIVTVTFFILISVLGVYFAPRLKTEIEELLSQRTGLTVRVHSLEWSLWPTLQFKGRGLSIGSSQEENRLFVYVETLKIQASFSGLLNSPRSVESATLENTVIRVPSRKDRLDVQVRPAAIPIESASRTATTPLILGELVLETAAVEILSREDTKPPRIIQIRRLVMREIAPGQSSPFKADLRYPRPEGDVFVDGKFGPFDRDEPIQTPVSGKYAFEDADLTTFREISGTLSAKGRFSGDLGENHVEGLAKIFDFQLTKVQHIVPLEVSFEVDRIAGDVYLREVATSFLQSRLHTTGEIKGRPQAKGRVVDLQVKGDEARIEDLLCIALKGDQPPLNGRIQLDTSVTIPPGPGRVMQRMIVDGVFSIREGEFTNDSFQKKLAQISRIGRNDQNANRDNRTFSDLTGEFHLEEMVIEFSRLHFGVPGMIVSLTGNYDLEKEQMDFRGRVEMERSVSEMTSGRLSDWLRVLDPVLRRGNAGTSVPIRIKGTRSRPSVVLDF